MREKKGKFKTIVDGIVNACMEDDSMYRMLLFSFGLFFAASLFSITTNEQLALFTLALLSLFAELINTSIEYTVDRSGEEFHPLAMRAKDSAATASFLIVFLFTTVSVIFCYNSLQNARCK